jgi:hypothetical protein
MDKEIKEIADPKEYGKSGRRTMSIQGYIPTV